MDQAECSKCHQIKDLDQFYRRASGQIRRQCKTCMQSYDVQWQARNSTAKRRADRRRGYLRRYGITQEEYDALLEKQGGVCAICKQRCRSKKLLSVDHDHKTKKVRGLLCANCNHGLGHFKDTVELLRAAALYLEAAIFSPWQPA